MILNNLDDFIVNATAYLENHLSTKYYASMKILGILLL